MVWRCFQFLRVENVSRKRRRKRRGKKDENFVLGLFVENGLDSLHTMIEPRRGEHKEMCNGPESSTLNKS